MKSNPARNATTGTAPSTAPRSAAATSVSASAGGRPSAWTMSSVMPWTRVAPGGIGTPGSISHTLAVSLPGACAPPVPLTRAAWMIRSLSRATPVVSVSKPRRGPSNHRSLMAHTVPSGSDNPPIRHGAAPEPTRTDTPRV